MADIVKPEDLLKGKKDPLSLEGATAAMGLSDILFDSMNQIGTGTISPEDSLREKLAQMRKNESTNTLTTVGKRATQGAIMGTAIPIFGTAIGAAAGTVIGGIESLVNKKKNKEQMASLSKAQADSYRNIVTQNQQMAKGGVVKGKGGPKSDSISTKLGIGDFVIPAENAGIAKVLAEEVLGKNPNEKMKAPVKGSDVKLSNGEFVFSSDEALQLATLGIDLNALAPNSDYSKNFSKGGENPPDPNEIIKMAVDEAKDILGEDASDSEIANFVDKSIEDVISNPNVTEKFKAELKSKAKIMKKSKLPFMEMMAAEKIVSPVIAKKSAPKTEEKALPDKSFSTLLNESSNAKAKTEASSSKDPSTEKKGSFVKDNLAKILGAGQIAAGLGALAKQGKEPELTVSPLLRKMYGEANKDALDGMTFAEKAATEGRIVRSTNNAINQTVGGGESQATKYNRTVSMLDKKNQAFLDLLAMDEGVKRENKNIARGLGSQIVQREDFIQNSKLNRSLEESKSYGDLVAAGIGNIVGADKMKNQLEQARLRKEQSNIFG